MTPSQIPSPSPASVKNDEPEDSVKKLNKKRANQKLEKLVKDNAKTPIKPKSQTASKASNDEKKSKNAKTRGKRKPSTADDDDADESNKNVIKFLLF